MIPIRDINPTVIRPVITLALIAINVAIFFAVQPPSNDPDAERFAYEYAAIPCELRTNDPLETTEVRTGQCLEAEGACDVLAQSAAAANAVMSLICVSRLCRPLLRPV